jgi:putative transposase
MRRQRSLQVPQRDEALRPHIPVLKAEPPFWGYRSMWASLPVVERLPVNKKRLLRLRREPHLLVRPHQRLRARRTPTGGKPQPRRPNEWWGRDMTTVLVAGCGWVSSVVVLEWDTKQVGGDAADVRGTTPHWLAALDRAVNQRCADGVRGHGLSLRCDNGCQPTSTAFMEACRTLDSHQAFTSDNHPKGNADTERFIRTLNEECLWLREWTCPLALVRALTGWSEHDNEHDLHSALGDRTPRQVDRDYYTSHGPPFAAA